MSRSLSPDAILAALVASPNAAWWVACRLRVAGPWTLNGHRWERASSSGWEHGGTLASVLAPTTYRALARADADLRAKGIVLAGAWPEGEPTVVPACGVRHMMTQGRPRLALPTDPRLDLVCEKPAGHHDACGALHACVPIDGDDRSDGDVWWTAANATTRNP